MTNQEITGILKNVAAAQKVLGANRFRIIAYERAASVIEALAEPLLEIWQAGHLEEVPQIGKGLAKYLDELFQTGHSVHLDKILAKLPPAFYKLLEVPGIGPKTAAKLCQHLKLKRASSALEKLQKAAQKGLIRQFEDFGQESERKLLENLKQHLSQPEKRLLLGAVWPITEAVIAYLRRESACLGIYPLGSLRRMVETVGDLDLAVSTNRPAQVIKFFLKYPQIKKVLTAGDSTVRVKLTNNLQVDLKTQSPQAFGAMLQHFTGSKSHNIALRELALKKGLSLSEYGIKKGVKITQFRTEKSFYAHLGLEFIPPELRENKGEIQAAQKNSLPKLVSLKDIRGDLHLHSNFPIEPSHDLGLSRPEEIIQKALQLHYEYLVFSEHNPSLAKHSQSDILGLLQKKQQLVTKLNQQLKEQKKNLHLFNSLEVDIRPDGQLALPEKAFALLDFLMVSVHSSFQLSSRKMTARILRALANPRVKILGHPTGRLLQKRPAIKADWPVIFKTCQKNQQFLEINASPQRLDLPDFLIREAVKIGVKMVINTDSHEADTMDNMFFGVSSARRGWAQKKDILNTLPCDRIKTILLS